MFEISKYKKSNVKLCIRLPENMNETLRKIAKKEEMSFNNVIVSCIQNSLNEMDLSIYKDVDIYENDEIDFKNSGNARNSKSSKNSKNNAKLNV